MKPPSAQDEPDDYYIRLRNYGREKAPEGMCLTRPTKEFTKIIFCQLQRFKQVATEFWAARDLLDLIKEALVKVTNDHFPRWFDESHPCYQHRLDAITIFNRVKGHAKCRENNKESFHLKKLKRKSYNRSSNKSTPAARKRSKFV
ncbi:hypothetical protein QAD02_000513 [Eretmocerus hayati]|uniref:Uncharacterized protein n=1 Tax=Eretmocerus hayati TaxID=131215 RepID=A0ACC2NDV7_9HYME|nr:hypothetical protein QAD02_000513 [Eretmocerus hayati]